MKKIANKTSQLVALLVLSTTSCQRAGMFDCDNQLKSRAPSVDGKYVVSVLSVQCGATTADASWVVLTRADEHMNVENDKFAVFEGDDVSAGWNGNDLQVSYKESRPFRMDSDAKGIVITYRKTP